MRIRFNKGKQKRFILDVMENSSCPSLGELSRRMGISYSTFKNYFAELRLLPEQLFEDLCFLGKIDKNVLKTEGLADNWGQIEGGKKGRR